MYKKLGAIQKIDWGLKFDDKKYDYNAKVSFHPRSLVDCSQPLIINEVDNLDGK